MNQVSKSQIITRRLLLAKEIYLHGLEKTFRKSSLNKIIAIHNFHNAIEITLKTILICNDIRSDKTLNIDFESMLNEIDRHPAFKEKNQKLPYRQELRNLNSLRNLTQHHAVEPESSTMEEWKVFTRGFLVNSYKDYFDLDFDQLSRISFIENETFRILLERAEKEHQENEFAKTIIFSTYVYKIAKMSFKNIMPSNNIYFSSRISSLMRRGGDSSRAIQEAFENVCSKIQENEITSAILVSGIEIAQLNRFKKLTPALDITMGGRPVVEFFGNKEYSQDDSQWILDFVTNLLILWQEQDINVEIEEFMDNCAKSFATEELLIN